MARGRVVSAAMKRSNAAVGRAISEVHKKGIHGHKVSRAQEIAVGIHKADTNYQKAHGGHHMPSVVAYNRAHPGK